MGFGAGFFSFLSRRDWMRNRRSAARYGVMTSRLTPGVIRVTDDLVISAIAVTQIGDLTIKRWLAINYGLTISYSYFDVLNIGTRHWYMVILRDVTCASSRLMIYSYIFHYSTIDSLSIPLDMWENSIGFLRVFFFFLKLFFNICHNEAKNYEIINLHLHRKHKLLQ